MSDLTNSRGGTLVAWQRQHVIAAVAFLRERFGNPPADTRALAVHDALLEVVDPPRRVMRLQVEMAKAAQTASRGKPGERRGRDRRRSADRRKVNLGPPDGVERRKGGDRREQDRRRNG